MADSSQRRPATVPGPWFVDNSCIACGSCAAIAPENFSLEADGMAYLSAQPADAEQEARCQEALEACPVEAIGKEE